jgi:hypothetical protein
MLATLRGEKDRVLGGFNRSSFLAAAVYGAVIEFG